MSFNPHPASLPGDARSWAHCGACHDCFNPHPASLPGDAGNNIPQLSGGLLFQSAPGIAASLSRVRCGGFNPHPASLPGDAALAYVDVLPFVVSIRTRHRCRVMPFWVVPAQLTPKVSIRTRHRCRVMPCTVTYWSILSRVSIRTRHRCRVMQVEVSGQPRIAPVSIRTRHRCRVMPGDL